MTKQEVINKLETIIADEVLTKDEQIYLSGTGGKKIKKVIDEFEKAVREETIREVLDEIMFMKEIGFELDYEIEDSIKKLTK